MVDLLIANGADVNAIEQDEGKTPLLYAIDHCRLLIAVAAT